MYKQYFLEDCRREYQKLKIKIKNNEIVQLFKTLIIIFNNLMDVSHVSPIGPTVQFAHSIWKTVPGTVYRSTGNPSLKSDIYCSCLSSR